MKCFLIFLVASLYIQAATYYVASSSSTPAGSDSNNGAIGTPWLTFAHAVANVATGDTITIVADGNQVNGDATLPANITNIIVQSSKLQYFGPPGYRTNPVNDSSIYGKLQFNTGIVATGEVHGFNQPSAYQQFTLSGSTFTVASAGWTGDGYTVANGTQLEFELNNNAVSGGAGTPPVGLTIPASLTQLTHYYVVNCSSCGAMGGTFQLAATSGGAPINPGSCNADCLQYSRIGLPIQINTSNNTINITDGTLGAAYVNGAPVTFATGGVITTSGTMGSPIVQDVVYYVRDKTTTSFTLAATLGGSVIPLTTVGTGMQSFSNAVVPNGWKFSGIEFVPVSGQSVVTMILVGSGRETAIKSMVNHFEFDRTYCHDFSESETGPTRCFSDGAEYLYIHDSWIAGMKGGESQCIFSLSLGPTAFTNNFCEAAGENTLSGGAVPTYYPLTPQNKQFIGNYLYKPFLWKYLSAASGTPSGACLYDASDSPDPNHRGGEYFLNTMTMQGYACNAGTWATTGSSRTHHTVKNIVESKSARNYLYSGNLLQGSWTDAGQAGQAFTFGQSYDSGPGYANDHITATNNKVTGVYEFFLGGSVCTGLTGTGPCLVVPGNHTFTNNLGIMGGTKYCGIPTIDGSCTTQMSSAGIWNGTAQTIGLWNKNTLVAPDGIVNSGMNTYYATSWYYGNIYPTAGAALHNGINFSNGIISYDVQGASDTGTFHAYSGVSGDNGILRTIYPAFQNSTFTNVALIAGASPYTAGTTGTNTVGVTDLPANTAAVKFVDATGGDYHLDPTSPYSAAGGCATFCNTDGTDLAADIDAVNMATSGAAAGTPPVNASLVVNATSTKLVFRYQAQNTSACTAKVYSAPARISGNQVASVADSNANSISDILTRQIYISGLTASTHYWYSISGCYSTPLVGDFYTRAAGSGTYNFTFDWSANTAMRYSASATMSSPTNLSAATRQTVPVATNSVIYAQVGTTGPITILVTP